METDKPTAGSLADRISQPEASATGTNAAAQTFVPSGSSWADDVDTPTEPTPAPADNTSNMNEEAANITQNDGATEAYAGSSLQEPEFDVNVKLSDMQADPNNPLYSIKSFEELNLSQEILKGIYAMNFRKPSKIQERALPLLLANPPTNMIGQSQSGTGKTAAFVLNILTRIDISNEQMACTPQALVLAPTRELARQILGVIEVMGQFVPNLRARAAIPMESKDRGQPFDVAVVVGTPGTVMDMVKRKLLATRAIKVLVLDEADNMLEQTGLGEQCIRVRKGIPPNIQVVLFSATFPNHVVEYATKFAPEANQITLRHEELTVEGIKQVYLDCPNPNEKYDILVRLYGLMTIGSSIIFVKTRVTANEIARRMTAEGHHVAALTGEYDGAARDVIIDAFRKGEAKVLIATNVLSRGIDVSSVSLVINYDIPDMPAEPGSRRNVADPQTYLHRIGRTGRFGRVGVSITFISNRTEWTMLMDIQNYFKIEMTQVSTNDWDELEETVSKLIKSSRSGSNFNSRT